MSRPPYGRTVPGNRWDLLDGLRPEVAPLVSVVVIHYRQPAELARTLAALARQTHPAARLEVLVADDGSPEAPAVPAGVTLLRQEDRGFRAATARNLGARHARGDVLCFLDADTVPEPQYVSEMARLPALAPETVTVGRRRHADLAGAPPDAAIEEVAQRSALAGPAWLERGYADSRNLLDADDRSYRFVISAALACSRWFFEELGGFDETFAVYGGEDWEWAARAWRAGALLAHVPSAVTWHDGPDWAGRPANDPGRRAAKNNESLRLADAIPVAGSRGRALRGGGADVLVRVPDGTGLAAAFVCADCVLAELPEATVVVPNAVASRFAAEARVMSASAPEPRGIRVVVDLKRPVSGSGLRAAVDRIAADGLGALVLTGPGPEVLARVVSRRAAARAERWGTTELFPEIVEPAAGLEPLEREPDLERHLGRWT